MQTATLGVSNVGVVRPASLGDELEALVEVVTKLSTDLDPVMVPMSPVADSELAAREAQSIHLTVLRAQVDRLRDVLSRLQV